MKGHLAEGGDLNMHQTKDDENMKAVADKELQAEMVGVLTAMSIVSKRLANQLSILHKDKEADKKTK